MSRPLSNGQIAAMLERHGRLLEITGESAFRARAYTRAAEAINLLPERLDQIAAAGRLRGIPGVGAGIAAIIEEILSTGTFASHEELTRQYPESIMELTALPGVGAKTAVKLFTTLGIDSVASLEHALISGDIAAAKGLGPRLETTIRSGIEALQRRSGRTPLGVALPLAHAVLAAFAARRPEDEISLAGSARRWEVTVGDLDFVIATDNPSAAIAAMAAVPTVTSVAHETESSLRLELAGGLEADVYVVAPDRWGSALLRATGSTGHLELLGEVPNRAASEEEIYAAQGYPWIPPELRAGGEEFARSEEISSLVSLPDINGELHAHTTWSDGAATVHEMAEAAARRGYTFLGITDHSHGLGVAGGLDVARLAAQRRELAEVNGAHGVTLLAGAEVEVHRDGSLDFDDETLARLDVVVASLHSGLRQPREVITARLLAVLENPNVDIIAHPTGRLIERREGGDFDWNPVFATAARTGTALEINADPARLDLDPGLASRASAAGCVFTINCDAHHPSGFALMEYGVAMARKAWLKPHQIINCWSRDQLLTWLAARRRD